MTGSYSVQNSVARSIYKPHVKIGATKYYIQLNLYSMQILKYVVEFMGFYGLPTYNGFCWLKLKN